MAAEELARYFGHYSKKNHIMTADSGDTTKGTTEGKEDKENKENKVLVRTSSLCLYDQDLLLGVLYLLVSTLNLLLLITAHTTATCLALTHQVPGARAKSNIVKRKKHGKHLTISV
jgi:hypothetical protein